MSETTLTARELSRATLARQMLLEREPESAVAAVERLCGMQAQEPRPPFVGLWTRLDGFRPDDLLDPLRAGKVVRATLMRATLHLLSARDYRRLRSALDPMMAGAMGPRTKDLDLHAVMREAAKLLRAGPLTFNELRAALAERFPRADDRGLGRAVRLGLPLVMVATDDRWGFARDSRFAPAESVLGKPPAKRAATGELLLRYLAAFGPATSADFQTWSGLGGTRAIVDGVRERLVTFRDERGRELLDLPDAPRPGADVPAPVRLLPDFDNLLLAHDDRTRVIADEHRPLVATKNLRIKATFLVDGIVGGTWAVERKGKRATLRIEPFKRLRKADAKELEAEAEKLLGFLEGDAATLAVKVG
jgi:DNA glycosylase AlkZ-like